MEKKPKNINKLKIVEIRKADPNSNNLNGKSFSKPSNSTAKKTVEICHFCKCKVNIQDIKQHLEEECDPSLDENEVRSGDWYELNSVDSRDGSKYIGYLAREYEESRWGSHPIHDPYGEESSPD